MSDKQPSRKILVRRSAAEITAAVCEMFKIIICECVDKRGVCRLALAGGTTPYALYHALKSSCAVGDVPWANVDVFFGDERDVPHDHVESNFGMVQRTLLDHVPIEPDHIYPMPADADDLDAAAEKYEQSIRRIVQASKDSLPRFDLVLLGMGADGHTASIFPFTDAVDEKKKLVMSCFVPVLGRNRMTLTFPLINAAENIILLVTGADKAQAVAGILGHDKKIKKRLPAAKITPTDGTLFIALDSPAATTAGLKPN